jgi:hypothetical protein
MHEEADQHENDQEELGKPQVRCHDDVPFHSDERRQLYRIYPLLNYPLDAGTPPNKATIKSHVVTQLSSQGHDVMLTSMEES